MIDALIQGKLHAKAQQRIGKAGRPFVTAKVTTTAKDGAQQFVNVIAFAPDACNALLALGPGMLWRWLVNWPAASTPARMVHRAWA